ncbi:GtrA family protein [uncultured Thiocystis sp.]|jgi:putative flippase GtrA|uniref:GtrA family protein n=1 Tax=uncultured Thiocystis sp. TaxID=1202134 RepID=UPI0025F4ED67|nr:GtrA family protein [uncultured Thiocystis sp.]
MGAEFSRYILSGVINTGVGYLVFLFVLHVVGAGALFSNAISYAFGLVVAYILNVLFVFESSRHSLAAAIRFLGSFGVSYGVNAMVLLLMVDRFGVRAEISQIFAMAAYTMSFYLLNKHFVWAQ